MSGKDGTRPGPDLLASLPGESRASDAALVEAVRAALGAMRDAVGSEIAALREEVAGLRRAAQADRPEPATREDLDRLGGCLEDRMESLRSPAGGRAEDAARAAAAADRAEAAVERLADRIGAMFGRLDIRLAAMSPKDGAAEKIEAALYTMSNMNYDANHVRTELVKLRRRVEGHLGGRAFLAPWAIFVFLLGMALESRLQLLYRWLWAS